MILLSFFIIRHKEAIKVRFFSFFYFHLDAYFILSENCHKARSMKANRECLNTIKYVNYEVETTVSLQFNES